MTFYNAAPHDGESSSRRLAYLLTHLDAADANTYDAHATVYTYCAGDSGVSCDVETPSLDIICMCLTGGESKSGCSRNKKHGGTRIHVSVLHALQGPV